MYKSVVEMNILNNRLINFKIDIVEFWNFNYI